MKTGLARSRRQYFFIWVKYLNLSQLFLTRKLQKSGEYSNKSLIKQIVILFKKIDLIFQEFKIVEIIHVLF